LSRNPCQDSLPTTGIHATMCCACQTLLLFRRFLLVPIHSRPCSIGVGSRVPTTRRACAVSSPWPWSRAFSNPPFRRSAENRSLGRGQLSCFGGVSSSANIARYRLIGRARSWCDLLDVPFAGMSASSLCPQGAPPTLQACSS